MAEREAKGDPVARGRDLSSELLAVFSRSEDSARRHRRAADTHERVAEHHEEAARFWRANNDPELAGLEERNAVLAREMALLERDCAELADRRAS